MGSKVNLDNCGITKEQADEIWRITRPKKKLVALDGLDDDTYHNINKVLLGKEIETVRRFLMERKSVR